ncbi:diguanylate cyclase (GGDEF) domain-containing protein [Lachnospiraceae bacterium XBB1006]|nr:diguanylate cyclase (GGDEF) domain-containing protein [Lachnospiraceae bacterium XBB1006]
MGKEFFAGFYLVAGTVIATYLFRAMLKKDTIGKIMARALGAGLVADMAYILYLCSNDYFLMSVSNSLVFTSIDWCLFFLLQFVVQFTGIDTKGFNETKIAYTIVGLDCLHLLANPFLECSMHYRFVQGVGGKYLQYRMQWPFFVHLTLCYIMVGWIFVCLFMKYRRVANFYRARYAVINIAFMTVIVLNIIFILIGGNVDFSILTYAILSCFLYFYVYDYKGTPAANATKAYFVEEVNNPIVFFDYEGRMLMSNRRAREVLALNDDENLDSFLQRHSYLKLTDEREQYFETTLIHKDCVIYFQIQYKFLQDKDGKTIGQFFVYDDITDKKRALIQTEYNATHDILTGTYNRNYYATFKKEIDEKGLYPVYGAIYNINGLRMINQNYGVETGDKVLKRMAWLMQQFSRVTDYVIRMDGGEMALILPETSERKANEIFQKIERRIGTFEVEGIDVTVESSYFQFEKIEDFDRLYEEARWKVVEKKKREQEE